MTRLLAFALLLLSIEGQSAESVQGDIRFHADTKNVVWVGQELELQLDLLSTGFSFGGQVFSLPEVKGAYLLQADSNTVKLNEVRGGETWQGLRYSLLLYPQREGLLEVPAFEVRFTASAGFGMEPAAFRFDTETLQVEARMPPGADRQGLVVTSADFTMQADWKPRATAEGLTRLKVGDAVKLTITRRAQDVPGMVFSPLPEFTIDGLHDYPDAPLLNDQINRGELVGMRTDTVTFICEREGEYEIPGIRFQWWDPDNEVLNEEVLPSLRIEVAQNTAFATAASTRVTGGWIKVSWQHIVLAISGLILAIFIGWRMTGILSGWMHRRRQQREAGEAWAFHRAIKACSSGTAPDAYQAITIWLTRCDQVRNGLTLHQLAKASGDPDLHQEVECLQQAVASGSDQDWNGRGLGQLLRKFRSSSHRQSSSRLKLAPLNPE